MASTVTPITATITISEGLTLGGVDRSGAHTRTIQNIAEADRRVLTIPSSSEINILSVGTSNGQGTFIRSNIRYIRITNYDNTNFVRIRVSRTSHDTFDLKLPAGATFMISTGDISANSSGSAFSSFDEWDVISAQSDTADVDIELVALTV
jgi:hypothetical protein